MPLLSVFGSSNGIARPVQRWLDGQDPAVRIEQRTEAQELVSVVHRWKTHVWDHGKSRRGRGERHQRSVEEARIIALGRLGSLAIALAVPLPLSWPFPTAHLSMLRSVALSVSQFSPLPGVG